MCVCVLIKDSETTQYDTIRDAILITVVYFNYSRLTVTDMHKTR